MSSTSGLLSQLAGVLVQAIRSAAAETTPPSSVQILQALLARLYLFAKTGEINDAAEIHLTHDVTGRVLCVRVSEQWCF